MSIKDLKLGEMLFRLLMLAYPRGFRRRYGEEMLQWFRDELSGVRLRRESAGYFRFWFRLIVDALRSVPAEHVVALSGRRRHPDRPGGLLHMVEDIPQDLRIALRSFTRAPAPFLVIVATMAVAIGFVTTLFSVIDGVLLAPLPYHQSERLVRLGAGQTEEGRIYALSMPEALHLEERSQSFESVAMARGLRVTLGGENEPELYSGAMVSASFFDVLGVQLPLGRSFLRSEDEPVVILAHDLWEKRFGADPATLGRSIHLGSRAFTVVGVLPKDFHPPEALGQRDAKLWISLSLLGPEVRGDRINHFLGAIARLRPDISPRAAQAELSALGEEFIEGYPGEEAPGFGLVSLHRETVGTVAEALVPLFGAVALLLLIACANIATLLLIRSAERAREMAVRGAMGAPRGRLVRQLLTESLLVGTIGGGLGIALAFGGVELFRAYSPSTLPRMAEVAVDGQVLGFGIAASLLTSLLFGLAPALRASSLTPASQLRDGGRGTAGTGRRAGLKNAFVVAEVAVAFMLVVGAGLLVNSFIRLHGVDLGFDPQNVHVLSPGSPRGATPEEVSSFFRDYMQRVAGLPGVAAVGATGNLPMSGSYAMRGIDALDRGPLPTSPGFDNGYSIYYQYVTPGFFEALGIARLRGRSFTAADGPEAPTVAILNFAAARDLFGDEEAVGRRFRANDGYRDTWYEVVGVVADSRQHRLAQVAGPELYLSFDQAGEKPSMDVVVRTEGPVAGILPAMKAELRALRADVPIRRAVEMEAFLSDSISAPRFYTLTLASFAMVALLLALIGIHGVLAYAVSQRTQEIGIRMALGAGEGSVLGLILRQGALLVGLGVAVGLAGALATTRVLRSLVFGVTTTDVATLAASILLVVTAAFAISLLPAWRAVRLDPLKTLRKT